MRMSRNKNEKIAIVGGGLSGLSIAHFLKKKGYKNLTIFEKENRLGGKLFTYRYKNRTYELGATFGLSTQKHLNRLMEDVNIRPDGPSLVRVYYDEKGERTIQIPKRSLGDFVSETDRLPKVLEQYPSIKEFSFEKAERDLLQPFSKWCDNHGFSILPKIYQNHFTSYGLGEISNVPAMYVLRAIDYDSVRAFLEVPELFTWESGASEIITRLGENLDDIRLGQEVLGIKEEEGLRVKTPYETTLFDKIIWTAPLTGLAGFFEDPVIEEGIGKITVHDYSVHALSGDHLPRGCGCVLPFVKGNKKGVPLIWINRWDPSDLITVFSYRGERQTKEEHVKRVIAYLNERGAVNVKPHRIANWKQGPYLKEEVLKRGFYPLLKNMQGKKGLYLAGEILSGVSMDKVIGYGNAMVEEYF